MASGFAPDQPGLVEVSWCDAEGQRVTMAYQRSNPRNAVIDEGRANYTDMIFATAVVVVMAVWYVADRLF